MKRAIFKELATGIAVIFSIVLCVWCIYRWLSSNEELASKQEWSVIQSIEHRHRGESSDKVMIEKVDEYYLAGIPVNDDRKMIWVMLNARNPSYYKQLPAGNYTLTKQDFERLLASKVVTSTVQDCLKSHIEVKQRTIQSTK